MERQFGYDVDPIDIEYGPEEAPNGVRVTYAMGELSTVTITCLGNLEGDYEIEGDYNPDELQPRIDEYLGHARAVRDYYHDNRDNLEALTESRLSGTFRRTLTNGPENDSDLPLLLGHYTDPATNRTVPAWLHYERTDDPAVTTPILLGEFGAPVADALFAQLLARDRYVFTLDASNRDAPILPRCSERYELTHLDNEMNHGYDTFLEAVQDYSRDTTPTTPAIDHAKPVGAYVRVSSPAAVVPLLEDLRNDMNTGKLLIVFAVQSDGTATPVRDLRQVGAGRDGISPMLSMGAGPNHDAHIGSSPYFAFKHSGIRTGEAQIDGPSVDLRNPDQPPRIGGTR